MHGTFRSSPISLRDALVASMKRRSSVDPIDHENTIRLVAALDELYRLDSYQREAAIEASSDGRPAYVTGATYHNQAANGACDDANGPNGLAAALRNSTNVDENWPGKSRMEILAALIPVNKAAVIEHRAALAAAADDARQAVRDMARQLRASGSAA